MTMLLGAALASTCVLAAGPVAAEPDDPARAAPERQITYRQWDSGTELRNGLLDGARLRRGRVVLAGPELTARRTIRDTTYDVGSWVSPWVSPGFGLTELIASWSATTPGRSWVEVSVRGRDAGGARSSWDVLGKWASGDRHLRRRSIDGQSDDLASVNVDTWVSDAPAGLTRWQLKVSLLRAVDATSSSPSLDTVGAMASRLPAVESVSTSQPRSTRGRVLDVPRYSQMTHRGHYPKWDGGGEAWCSPTATSMVLGYYDALPARSAYSWVGTEHVDAWVDHAARSTYDNAFDGTGNWPFNTAYAAPLAGHAFVTRLRSLRQAEQYVNARIPLIASIAFGPGDLDGAPIPSSNGHVLVIVGFTAAGDVVVNDPAAAKRSGVRRTYDRGQFENAWIPTTGGVVYVITDDAHPLP